MSTQVSLPERFELSLADRPRNGQEEESSCLDHDDERHAKATGTIINTALYQVDCWRKCAGTFCMAIWPIFFIVGRISDVLTMTARAMLYGWVGPKV